VRLLLRRILGCGRFQGLAFMGTTTPMQICWQDLPALYAKCACMRAFRDLQCLVGTLPTLARVERLCLCDGPHEQLSGRVRFLSVPTVFNLDLEQFLGREVLCPALLPSRGRAFEASRWGAPDEREEPRVVHRARGAGRAACHP